MTDRGLDQALRPCPFCGGEAEIRMDTDISGGGLYVYAVCRLCGAHRKPEWAQAGQEDRKRAVCLAVHAWNKRRGFAIDGKKESRRVPPSPDTQISPPRER